MHKEISKKLAIYVVLILTIIAAITITPVYSAIEMLSDEELSDVDGQFSEISIVNHNQENDTVRIFLDIHQEVYGTIDSARVGYYYKDSSQLRSTPLQFGASGYEGYYHGADTINNGANFAYMKVTSDFNTMAPANGATLQPWGNGSFDSTNETTQKNTLTKNVNNFDWDIWADQIQLGESPDKPQYVNGLIIRMEFDNSVYSENPHLERLVIGTNDLQGNSYYNVQRITAAMNGLLVTNSTNRSAGAADPYSQTGGTMLVQRDTLVQCFGVTAQGVEDRDTGNFIIINLEGDHLGFTVLAGYPENGADFTFTGSDTTTGMQGIDLFSPSWARYSGGSGMSGSDPYGTSLQEDYKP